MNAHAPALDAALPICLEAEQALLGALLLNEHALANVGFLEARHFGEELHARIYSSMLELAGAGRKVSLITVGAQLANLQLPEGAPPLRAYLATLAREATTIADAPGYAELIVDAWARRELIALARAASDSARFSGTGRLQATLDELDAQIITLRNAGQIGAEAERTTLGAGLADVIREAEDRAAGNARIIPSTGFVDLDRVIGGGYRAGRLYVVAGNPGAGKTIFLVASARRVARLRDDRPQFGVDIYSLEIDRRELAARMAANAMAAGVAPLAYSDILAGALDEQAVNRLRKVEERFNEFAVTIDATPGLTIEQIESRAKRTKQRLERAGKTLDVVFIDYLQIMGFGDRYRGRKVDEIGEVTKGAKAMAKRLEVAVVLLSQLSRENQKRDDKRPQLFDLRDSGSIEQDADVVIGLHRPSYYDQRDPKVLNGDAEACERAAARANDLEVILMKNRLGPTTTVHLYCDVARSFLDNGERKW
ncbi:replicative DNA helicase [Methylosinus sp. LW4]|uniref:replicative DNA helicase n=1 Tax=Methylosinus sp. LW4 TaxID=136993 RepID=UPI00036A4ADF|nr:DnaB-like helicase C-terminal domain-containing protein [Methylosinus sp. LW4]